MTERGRRGDSMHEASHSRFLARLFVACRIHRIHIVGPRG